MALIQWKQIDGDLTGSRVLTGSLIISGTVQADTFIGIDPTAIFKSDGTNTVSASVNPDGTIFSVTRDGTDKMSLDENGNLVLQGSLTAQEFKSELISASILFESGSSQFGNSLDDTHKFTGSLFISGADGHNISGSLRVSTANTGSTAITSNNTTVGYPSSNQWQNNLDGSFFNNFDHTTHISEILRFMAGVMSSSLDVADATPNTKTWGSVSQTYTNGGTISKNSLFNGVLGSTYQNAKLSNNWNTSTFINSSLTGSIYDAQNYLISKGFLLNSETGSNNAGTNPFSDNYATRIPTTILTQGGFSTNSFTITANAAGSTDVSGSANNFGLGTLTNGGATPYTVRIEATQSYSDNYNDATPGASSTFSSSSLKDYTISSFGTSNGLVLTKILTSQPAVIPSNFQDGDFNNVAGPVNSRKYTSGATASNSISASGYYRTHDVIVGLKTGSQATFTEKSATNESSRFYLYTGDISTDITSGTRAATVSNVNLTRTAFSATSRSLSGAPYILSTSYSFQFRGEVSGSFDPAYGYSTNPITITRPTNQWPNIGSTSISNATVSVTSNGVQHDTANVKGILSADKNTQRSTNTVPFIDDIAYTTSSFSFSLNSNASNTLQTRAAQEAKTYGLKFRFNGRNWKGTAVTSDSALQNFYDNTLFGQTKSTKMAIYSRAQGYDASSLTGTSENFSGENHRIKVNNNVLGFNGDSFTTNSFKTNDAGDAVLTTKDLQVKPGFLVEPGGDYGYWFDSGFGNTSTYKYYIRKFQTSGAKTSMTVNVEKTLVNWDSSSDGIAAVVLFKSSASGSGANSSLSTARVYDPTETNSNVVESGVSADNFKNPFTDDLDLYGNIGGSISGTTYTMPLRNADGMFLDNSDNQFYLIIRYKGDPSPITDISISTS
tara:strand:- start:2215 stop:4902 length:2688 start_codon:yes stop_codon:yes gene_type:complete